MKLFAIILTIGFLSACASTEYIYVQPECEVPPIPYLPQISAEELEDVSDETYWKLEEREDLLYGWAEEMEEKLKTLCEAE